MSDELVFGVNVFDLDFGVQIDSVKQPIQSRATLCVRESCLIVGLRPLIIILITASLSSKTYNMALAPECIVLDGIVLNVSWNDVGDSAFWRIPTAFLPRYDPKLPVDYSLPQNTTSFQNLDQ